jgi:hypothetical protein
MEEQERWRNCLGYEAFYNVSSLGRVWSKRGRTGRFLKGTKTKRGYRQVMLSDGLGKKKCFLVHRLVATAFHGRCPPGKVCNHRDANKSNNRASNLEWVTPKENSEHAAKLGLLKNPNPRRGERHYRAKLKTQDVNTIRSGRKAGKTLDELARQFNVSKALICKVARNRLWRHVPSENSVATNDPPCAAK